MSNFSLFLFYSPPSLIKISGEIDGVVFFQIEIVYFYFYFADFHAWILAMPKKRPRESKPDTTSKCRRTEVCLSVKIPRHWSLLFLVVNTQPTPLFGSVYFITHLFPRNFSIHSHQFSQPTLKKPPQANTFAAQECQKIVDFFGIFFSLIHQSSQREGGCPFHPLAVLRQGGLATHVRGGGHFENVKSH